jgi:hypothetical protein
MRYHNAGVCVSVRPSECISVSSFVVLKQLTDLHENSYELHFIGGHLTLYTLHWRPPDAIRFTLEATWRYTLYIPALSNNNMEGARNCKAEVTLATHFVVLKLCVLEANDYKHGDVHKFYVVSNKFNVNKTCTPVISSAEN